ncbi:HNH endonuclease signature motif containing protein [Glutamicibacter creatinolyticus]|uniref:HNH endonuclease signature motif containing protein n=1 Tax=Glutamicibacter creatinolyticus TaxID=162496 RepID=UPI003401FA66
MAPTLPGSLMDRLTQLVTGGEADSPSGRRLRVLALLDAAARQVLDGLDDEQLTAAEALSMLRVTESLQRSATYARVRAAGAVAGTAAHRLQADSLSHALDTSTVELATGAPLPVNAKIPAAAKSRFRSEIDLVARVIDANFFAAKALVRTHRQLVGSGNRPAQFTQLSSRFADASQNPATVGAAAAKLGSLQLSGARLRDAERRVDGAAAQGHSAVKSELKSISEELSAPDLAEREAVHERCAGLRYRGLGPYGHVWELTCTTTDHELLLMTADRLSNPNLAANRQARAAASAAPESPSGETSDPSAVRARKLLRTVLDIVRQSLFSARPATATPRGPGEPTSIAAPNGSGLVLPSMVDLLVTIEYDALRGMTDAAGLTSHGQRISASELRCSASIGGIIPGILGGAGEVLDLGRRRRLFTIGQTRSVVARDRGCINPGCTMPAHRCEVNHCQPWVLGGKTSVDNGCLLCKSCHLAFHAGFLKIRMVNGVPYVLQSPQQDPEQRYRRNWVWHPNQPALAA